MWKNLPVHKTSDVSYTELNSNKTAAATPTNPATIAATFLGPRSVFYTVTQRSPPTITNHEKLGKGLTNRIAWNTFSFAATSEVTFVS